MLVNENKEWGNLVLNALSGDRYGRVRGPWGHNWSVGHPLANRPMGKDGLREAAKDTMCGQAANPANAWPPESPAPAARSPVLHNPPRCRTLSGATLTASTTRLRVRRRVRPYEGGLIVPLNSNADTVISARRHVPEFTHGKDEFAPGRGPTTAVVALLRRAKKEGDV